MKNDSIEITTICPDVENSQFVVQSNCPETIPEILKSQSAAANSSGIACQQRSLPRIKIFGTGGTIASKAIDSSQTAGYHVDLTIQDLLDAIPDISKVCDIEYEQLCNVDSKDINQDILYKIYKGVSESLQTFDGIVITHGTDTLSETAFFIESTIDAGDVPIVFVGSMRPSTSVSADGPMNLYLSLIHI